MSKRSVGVIIALLCGVLLVSCSMILTKDSNDDGNDAEKEELIVVGFSQLGAESDWRTANTQSMRDTLTEENGFKLIVEDGQQKQANQITAIRTFIQQEVDYIVLAPVTETGWDTVLQEAKEAGIPVIIIDRMIDVEDEGLFTCWVGSDFRMEGAKVTDWIRRFIEDKGIAHETINIVNIQGTIGSSSQIGRSRALEEAIQANGWNLLGEETGDYTQAKAREVMEDFLEKFKSINIVYCENDNQAMGAIEAIEGTGRTVGADIEAGQIMVVSFDGVSEEAIEYVKQGKITCIAECNPEHGPRVQAIIALLEVGMKPEKYSYILEGIFTANKKFTQVSVDGVNYEVSFIE